MPTTVNVHENIENKKIKTRLENALKNWEDACKKEDKSVISFAEYELYNLFHNELKRIAQKKYQYTDADWDALTDDAFAYMLLKRKQDTSFQFTLTTFLFTVQHYRYIDIAGSLDLTPDMYSAIHKLQEEAEKTNIPVTLNNAYLYGALLNINTGRMMQIIDCYLYWRKSQTEEDIASMEYTEEDSFGFMYA